jgi:carboxynorspermidine decarboxylase
MRTPFFYTDESLLIRNLEILRGVADRTGCRILLAQKAFSMYSLYPLMARYLHGTTASGLYEARLGHEEFGGETHIFSPAYPDDDFDEIAEICDCVVFNSIPQWQKFRQKFRQKCRGCVSMLRINPEHSTQNRSMYDPCAPGSRLGVTRADFRPDLLAAESGISEISGLHFHTLCEQNADALISTVAAVEEKFGEFLLRPEIKRLNIGGGHHITRPDYDIDALTDCVNRLQEKYSLTVYIEPGEAVVLNSGFLVTSVLDIVGSNVILDTSAACHMPDVLEVPYRPDIIEAGGADGGYSCFSYRLGGNTCLAGDVIGEYSFEQPLKIGDRLTFCDMAHYSMVKTNTFNGIPLPSIAIKRTSGELELVREFGYGDFKGRL